MYECNCLHVCMHTHIHLYVCSCVCEQARIYTYALHILYPYAYVNVNACMSGGGFGGRLHDRPHGAERDRQEVALAPARVRMGAHVLEPRGGGGLRGCVVRKGPKVGKNLVHACTCVYDPCGAGTDSRVHPVVPVVLHAVGPGREEGALERARKGARGSGGGGGRGGGGGGGGGGGLFRDAGGRE